jgi:hypothetical protein
MRKKMRTKKLSLGRILSTDERDFNLFDFLPKKEFIKQVYWDREDGYDWMLLFIIPKKTK